MLLPSSTLYTTSDFDLEKGGCFATLDLAYETYGTLDADGGNAILLGHGYTSNPHAGGPGGWWEELIGPGRAIDTDRFCVIASNMIGSSYGSTGPSHTDPGTGKPYGLGFPDITTGDMIEAQCRLLDHLGVGQLAAVVGFSYGGYLTFEWGTRHPDRMRALAPVATGITGRGDPASVTALIDRFAACPGWNGGDYYADKKGSGVYDVLVDMRVETLTNYGIAKQLEDTVAEPAERDRQMRAMATGWAEEFDANSLIALRKAAIRYDAKPRAAAIKAPLLYVLSRTDALFPPSLGPETVDYLAGVGVSAEYHALDSAYGHRGPSVDWAKWGPALKAFLEKHG